MSSLHCCVPGCLGRREDGVPLHRFPNPDSEEERYNSWIANIGGEIATLDKDTVRNNRRVCHKHFKDNYKYPKNRLNKLAIPDLLKPDCSGPSLTETLIPILPSTSFIRNIQMSVDNSGQNIEQDEEYQRTQVCPTTLKDQKTRKSKDYGMSAYRKVSPRQLELLVEFAEANLDIALGRCSLGPQGHQIATQSWKTLATSLNAVADGVTKTGNQWRRYWIKLKVKTRAKGADMRRSATRSGGGPNKLTPLTAIEERILHIGRVAVEGLPGVRIPFQVPDAPILSPLLPQPGSSSQVYSTPSQVETTSSVHENITPSTMTPEPDMKVEWIDDELISPPFELFPEPPNPLPAIPPTQSPPLTAAPVVLPTALPIPTVASPAPTEASQQRNRRRRSYIRDISRWAQDMEERLLYEERMVTIMEKVEQRLADINQNLSNISANLQR